MDLNELFFRHQIALMRADRSSDFDIRKLLHGEANALASRIGALQVRLGASSAPLAKAICA